MKSKSAYFNFLKFLLIHYIGNASLLKFSGWFLYQAHPWFKGIQWESLYQMEAAFVPEVNDELDTQNFEKFEEVRMVGFL